MFWTISILSSESPDRAGADKVLMLLRSNSSPPPKMLPASVPPTCSIGWAGSVDSFWIQSIIDGAAWLVRGSVEVCEAARIDTGSGP